VTATVAGLHMRTWSNTLPRRPHADAASWRPLHGKKRVPTPGLPVRRTRSPKDGLPRMLK